jgi:hydrogenase expression/formation protein HypD
VEDPWESRSAKALLNEIREACESYDGIIRLMEVCGTHTMAIHSAGIKSLFPRNLVLVSGPGCPVCVTEKKFIDLAVLMGKKYDACLATFGDLVKVPGTYGSLAEFRSEGGKIRIVYSPIECVNIASEQSGMPVIFLGVGFETTVPTIGATLRVASQAGVDNLYVLCGFKTIHEPLKMLAGRPNLSGFLLPGHVSAIIGSQCFSYLAQDFLKPGVVAGFEPLDILLAVRDLVKMVVSGRPEIVNDYKRVVRDSGNEAAKAIVEDVFEPSDASWRGLGIILGSGLTLREAYSRFDAEIHLPVEAPDSEDDPRCRCAQILTGLLTPNQCGLFGKLCTPEEPVGPCMVSSEGTCAAYYKYGTG